MKKTLLLLFVFLSALVSAQGLETFANFDRTGTSYGDGSFAGQDGSTWTYGQCRGDLELNGKAITMGRNRSSENFVESGIISGGMGTLEFSYVQAFATNVNMQVYVNNTLVYTATSTSEEGVVKSSGPIAVNVEGDVQIKFTKNQSSGQVTIDDIAWTGHSSGPNPDCDQGDDSNNFENGYNITAGGNFRNADDFFASANSTLSIEQIELNVFAGTPITAMNFNFYADNNGAPGSTVVHSLSNIPVQAVPIGSNFGMTVYAIFADVDLDFVGGTSTTRYWMQPEAISTSAVYWEVTEAGSLGTFIHTSETNGPWEVDADGANGVFKLRCTSAPLPDPLCTFDIGWSVEPITRVVMANVDNSSSPSSTEPLEDFTAITIEVEAGNSYPIAVEGTTEGSWTNYVTAFLDTSGNWSDFETYEIGSITNSTGNDGQQAVSSILIPADLAPGSYTLRIIKNFDESPLNPCGSYDFGQAEDYTVLVTEGLPNPDCDQGDDSNQFENGYNITFGGTYRAADDFFVSAGSTLNLESIELNLFLSEPADAINLTFYNDNNGVPGSTVVHSVNNIVPYAQVPVGSNFGFTIYAVFLEVDLEFTGGTSGTTYWMSPSAVADLAYWEVSSAGTLGGVIHVSEDNGPFLPDDDNMQGVFKLHCTLADPPPFQCLFDVSSIEAITRVIINNVDNTSPASSDIALEDFTDIHIYAEAGSTNPIALEGNTAGAWTNYFTVFIDKEGDWSDYLSFQIGSITNSTGTDGQQATGSITLPADLPSGNYTFRVVKNFGDFPLNPCGSYSFGQGEDYTLVVGEITDCTGTPNAGTTSVSPSVGNGGSTYMVTNNGHDFAGSMTYQWQSNTDNGGWTDEGTASGTYSSFTATAPAEIGTEVEWRLKVTCTASSEVSYSATATFTVQRLYCTPTLDCSDGDNITNVTFQEINNTTTCSPNGYGDYTDQVATVQAGGTYPMSVSVGDGWSNEAVSVWIDFNDNGTFEEEEFFFLGIGSGSTVTDNIAIPAAIDDGMYRMRVRVAAVGADTATWDMACDEDQFFGETEDYTVQVDGVVGIEDFGVTGLNYFPTPAENVLYITSEQQIRSVVVYNVLGQQVLDTRSFNSGKMDVSGLSSGSYMFRVTFESGITENFKVLKK